MGILFSSYRNPTLVGNSEVATQSAMGICPKALLSLEVPKVMHAFSYQISLESDLKKTNPLQNSGKKLYININEKSSNNAKNLAKI